MKMVITGGHHNSALPVIKELEKRYSDLSIFWFGHKSSIKGDKNQTLEYHEITAMDIPFYNLQAGKLYKTYDIRRLIKIPIGYFHALYLLFQIKPDIILSFGGYLAAPTVLAAKTLGIKSITHEQTVVAGYANKLIGKYVDKILLSWPQSKIYFPKEKIVVTGLPLREELKKVLSSSFETDNDLPLIYITAGKTGSHTINLAVKENLEQLLEVCNVIHQLGDTSLFNDYDDLQAQYNSISGSVPGHYFARKFVFADEIGEAFNKASLVVSRSGAHTIAELLYLQKPALLIPIPWVSHNEQFENAKLVKNSGLGEILEERDLEKDSLFAKVQEMLKNIQNYNLKDPSVLSFMHNNSTQLIVAEIQKTLESKVPDIEKP